MFLSNIDSRIRQAEIEYQLEREETNLLNLQDEKRQLLLRFGSGASTIQHWGRQQQQQHNNINYNSLFRFVAYYYETLEDKFLPLSISFW